MGRTAIVISVLVVSTGLMSGCGNSTTSQPSTEAGAPSTPSSSAPSTAAAGPELVIADLRFTVPPSVRAGQQVTILNNDSANHTVTADESNLFDVRVSGGGGRESFTAPATPGSYPFHCKYHAGMHGVLTVT